MRNIDTWRATKFELNARGRLVASPRREHVSVSSRMITDLMAREYEQAIRLHARGILADIGCGSAPLFGLYKTYVDRTLCFDWPKSVHDASYVDCQADLGAALPLARGSTDTVLATDVLEHLPDSDAFFSEVSRILRTGGTLILGTPFLYWIHEAPHDHFRLTRFALERLCGKHLLEVVSLREYGGPFATILDILGKNLPGRLLSGAFQAAARALIRSRPGQYLDRRRRDLFPLGYCLVARKL